MTRVSLAFDSATPFFPRRLGGKRFLRFSRNSRGKRFLRFSRKRHDESAPSVFQGLGEINCSLQLALKKKNIALGLLSSCFC